VPELTVAGARIHFRVYGDASTETPVVLIHGATSDGASDWGLVAPLLARKRLVIVPDCRGHGRSTNPDGGYSFARLAADTAELIRGLGHDRAHLVGHSNGGNVALVTLVEHPDVIASCIVQAGNAYVSADLVEIEPEKFDPDRVAREAPEWRDEMIALHGPTHGATYWRDLLAMTVAEIVSSPNYAPEQLQRVERPLLVIEGAEDRVNAAAGHGAHIARHIPFAESWFPAGVGHNVHLERPLDWIARVEDFWRRRGTPAADAAWRLASEFEPRETVFEVVATGTRGSVEISGQVLEHEQRDRIEAAIEGTGSRAAVTVLRDSARTAVVGVGVADVLVEPRSSAARATQGLLWERVEALDVRGDWTRVRLLRDGYVGWIRTIRLAALGHDTAPPDRAARVAADIAIARDAAGGAVVGRLPFGLVVPVVDLTDGWRAIRTPTGATWWLEASDVEDESPPLSIAAALERYSRFVGVPYLWGGRTPFGFDCSGLSQAVWASTGTVIPRDADQQFRAAPAEDTSARPADVVAGDASPGDLLFFRDPVSESPDITHVAISLGRRRFLHAAATPGGTVVGSFDPADLGFAELLRDALVGVRRYR
jgi:pimeloyl-ACP methyl ester carboxylesterase/cell wall-associated NlpC family hydrolase